MVVNIRQEHIRLTCDGDIILDALDVDELVESFSAYTLATTFSAGVSCTVIRVSDGHDSFGAFPRAGISDVTFPIRHRDLSRRFGDFLEVADKSAPY